MLDCIIRSGRVVDWYNDIDTVTDIAIKDGKIFSVGPCSEPATREIDASGLLVLPGIIDSHMHASCWLGGPMSFKSWKWPAPYKVSKSTFLTKVAV